MAYLFIVSIVWAFSFGLIKTRLEGVDFAFVAAVRLVISLLLFAPLIRVRRLPPRAAPRLILIGMIQFGLMYVAYIASFRWLESYQVAMFTVFTPLYVTLFNDIVERRTHRVFLLCALIAVAGALVAVFTRGDFQGVLLGFVVVQFANICFAVGQVMYRKLMGSSGRYVGAVTYGARDRDVFGLLYLGAAAVARVAAAVTVEWGELALDRGQALVLVYLGILPSGLGFFLWNIGARNTNAGALAIFNNAKIPLAVLVSLTVFHESANLARVLAGGGIMVLALVLNQRLGATRE